MKVIISTIVGGLALFILGWVFYGLLFAEYFRVGYAKIARSPDDYKLWAMTVSCFAQAFFMSWIYPYGYKGGSPVKEGLKFGLYAALLISVPYVFSFWGMLDVSYMPVIVDGIIWIVSTTIAGIVIGLVFGKQKKAAS